MSEAAPAAAPAAVPAESSSSNNSPQKQAAASQPAAAPEAAPVPTAPKSPSAGATKALNVNAQAYVPSAKPAAAAPQPTAGSQGQRRQKGAPPPSPGGQPTAVRVGGPPVQPPPPPPANNTGRMPPVMPLFTPGAMPMMPGLAMPPNINAAQVVQAQLMLQQMQQQQQQQHLQAGGRNLQASPNVMVGSPMTPPAGGMVPLQVGPRAPLGSPMLGMPGVPQPQVQTNQQTQQLQQQSAPPFACILLVGASGSGKTTIGRRLCEEMPGWMFFNSSDFIQSSSSGKATMWDSTKKVFDALSTTLDNMLANRHKVKTNGLLVEKQCRGVEDLWYLSAALKKRNLILNGVVSLDVQLDSTLLQRLHGDESTHRERIKHHRVVLQRILDVTKPLGLWHTVNGSSSQQDVLSQLHTMILGCASQTRQRRITPHSESSSLMMCDNYATYSEILSLLFTLVKPPKAGHFPAHIPSTPLTKNDLTDKRKASIMKEYCVRRKIAGNKYLLIFDEKNLYLVPRHMRCIYVLPPEAWLGSALQKLGKFVLDGDLARLSRERNKDKFIVSNVLYWSERDGSTNLVAASTYMERQERLKVNLCNEITAFFPKTVDIVIAFQAPEDPRNIAALMEACDYNCEGLIFQHTSKDDASLVWKPPEMISADFRAGPMAPGETPNTRVTALQVFDSRNFKYVQYENDEVEVPEKGRHTVVEGCIIVCTLELSESGKRSWSYQRIRNDVVSASTKQLVDDLVHTAVITKAQVINWIGTEPLRPGAPTSLRTSFGSALSGPPQPGVISPNAAAAAAVGLPAAAQSLLAAQQVVVGQPPQGVTSYAAAAAEALRINQSQRGQMVNQDPPLSPMRDGNRTMSEAAKLQNIIDPAANVKIEILRNQGPGAPVSALHADALESMLANSRGAQSGREDKGRRSRDDDAHEGRRGGRRGDGRTDDDRKERSGRRGKDRKNCHSCRARDAEGHVDERDGRFYCYACWKELGVDYCYECDDFATGKHDMLEATRRRPERKGRFYCNTCWEKYDKPEKKKDGGEKKERGSKRGDKKDAAQAQKDAAEKEKEKESEADKKKTRRGRRRSKDAADDEAADKEGNRPAALDKKDDSMTTQPSGVSDEGTPAPPPTPATVASAASPNMLSPTTKSPDASASPKEAPATQATE